MCRGWRWQGQVGGVRWLKQVLGWGLTGTGMRVGGTPGQEVIMVGVTPVQVGRWELAEADMGVESSWGMD